MNSRHIRGGYAAATVLFIMITMIHTTAVAGTALGPKAGFNPDSENLIIGAEAEMGRSCSCLCRRYSST